VQAEEFHHSIRPGLVIMLPRLMRFADLLVGAREEGTALLRRALLRILAEEYCYQRGVALDVWAFGEIYRHWLGELRDHVSPQAKIEDQSFARLFGEEGEEIDTMTASFIGNLPPQQRLTLLLVYGERLDHADAGRVLDVPAETIAVRMVRITAAFADQFGPDENESPGAFEAFYPEEPTLS
jgi:DNA-directed RNA polymerase specialized sigma24 family protein